MLPRISGRSRSSHENLLAALHNRGSQEIGLPDRNPTRHAPMGRHAESSLWADSSDRARAVA